MSVRSRFSELTDHLKNKAATLGVPPENFLGDIARMQLAPGGRNLTEQGWHLANLRYRGVLLIKSLPQSATTLMLIHCRAWLDEHDDTRNQYALDDPEATFAASASGDTVDLTLACDFVDPVYLNDDPEGSVEWNGRKSLTDYDLQTAEDGVVNNALLFPEETPE